MLHDSEPPTTKGTLRHERPETLARVRNAGRPTEPRWMDLVSLVEEAIEEVSEKAADARIDIAFMWTIPGVIKTDREPMVQALRTLFSASIEATQPGGRVGIHLYGLDRMVLEVRYGRRKLISKMRSKEWQEAVERCRRQVEPFGGTIVVDEEEGAPAAVKIHFPFT